MNELLTEHSGQLWALAGISAVLWLAFRVFGRSKVPHGDRIPLRVYCNHCNWEGTVTRASMACGRCKSRNVSVLAV